MDLATRKKISQTMKGKSNFAGHKHTHAEKIQIGISQQGHRNAKDHKWVTDKDSGEEHRVKGHTPKGMRPGRSGAFARWIHAKESVDPNNSANRLVGTDSLRQIYTKETPGQAKVKAILKARKK